MVSVDRDYPSAKIYAKVANSEDKGKCMLFDGGIIFMMGIQLLAVDASGMFQPINQWRQWQSPRHPRTSITEACSLAVEAPVV